MKSVRLTKPHKGLNAGEVGGFEDNTADWLVANKRGVLVAVEASPEPVAQTVAQPTEVVKEKVATDGGAVAAPQPKKPEPILKAKEVK